jgi:hypothetical protein
MEEQNEKGKESQQPPVTVLPPGFEVSVEPIGKISQQTAADILQCYRAIEAGKNSLSDIQALIVEKEAELVALNEQARLEMGVGMIMDFRSGGWVKRGVVNDPLFRDSDSAFIFDLSG